MTAPCDVLVIPMTEDRAPAVAAATALRASGLRCQLYTEQRKFKAKMSYADKIGTPFTVLLGEDELAEDVLAVKKMETGEQRKLTVEEASAWIWETVRRKNAVAPICG